MIQILLNAAAILFFLSELPKLKRAWKARFKMDSTSLEGTIVHLIGNALMVAAGVCTGAWITIFAESFLVGVATLKLCWKIRWLDTLPEKGVRLCEKR